MQSAQAEGLQDPAVVSAARTAYYNAMPPQASGVPESTQPQQQQQHAGNQPPPDPSSYPFPPESAPYPFRSYEKHWPCSPPRSRASSAASIASSARESLASTDPSDAFGSPLTALEKHPTKLHASGSAGGFLVEVSGGTDPGVWPVSWSELVALLSNPATSAPLPPDHLITRLAGFLMEQLHPATNLQFGGQQYGGPRQGEGYPAVTGSFEAMGMHGSPPMWNDDVRSVNSFAGFEGRSSSHLMDSDGHSLASFPPPSHRRTQGRPQGGSGRLAPGAGESYVTPLQRAFGQGQSNFASGAPSAILPPLPPLPDLSDAPRRRELHNSGRKMVARDAGRPYPSFAHSRTNSSSSVPTAAMDPHHLDGGLPMSGDEPAKPLRALNRDHETYVWKEEQGQLYRVAPGSAPSHGEMLVFPAGSYYKVYKDDLEIIPSDPAPRANDWIRGQSCVAECKGFRIENKRPATIRHHFASCKLREVLTSDPLGRLCKLQIAAGKRQKQYVKGREQSAERSYHYPRATSTRSRRSSISGDSFSSMERDDYGGRGGADGDYDESESWSRGEPQAGGAYGHEGYGTMGHPEEAEAPTEQALLAMMAGSSSAAVGYGAEGESGDWGGWLSTHGLDPPTGLHMSSNRSSVLLPDQPTASGSFLSMEE